jgi:hypothetical protein
VSKNISCDAFVPNGMLQRKIVKESSSWSENFGKCIDVCQFKN